MLPLNRCPPARLTRAWVDPTQWRGDAGGRVRIPGEPGSSKELPSHDTLPDVSHMPSTIHHAWFRWTMALLLSCSAPYALAELAVPGAAEWARMTPQQQAERREALQRQLQQASPQDRQRFRETVRERLESLTPEQRQGLINSARERWQAMTPAERREITEERRRRVEDMSLRERRALLRERRALLDSMTPQERRALREKLKPD